MFYERNFTRFIFVLRFHGVSFMYTSFSVRLASDLDLDKCSTDHFNSKLQGNLLRFRSKFFIDHFEPFKLSSITSNA